MCPYEYICIFFKPIGVGEKRKRTTPKKLRKSRRLRRAVTSRWTVTPIEGKIGEHTLNYPPSTSKGSQKDDLRRAEDMFTIVKC